MYKYQLSAFMVCFFSIFSHTTILFSNTDLSGYEYVYALSNQVMLSRALYVAADLELADHLSKPLSLEQLAQKTNSNVVGLRRLLRFLREHGLFVLDEKGMFYNNELSVFLKKGHPNTIRPFLLHDDPTRWNAIGNLGHSVKTGSASFDWLYQDDYFSSLQKDAVLSDRFDEAMTIISQKEDALIAQKVNFAGVVADIGGGKGQLLRCIHDYHQHMITKLILFDLEQVQQNVSVKELSIEQVSGSFFTEIDVKADVFILKRILHDWNDDKALQILQNVALAMDDNSVLYIVDAVVDQCQDKKLILDIDMRLLSIFGGQERSMREFEGLCQLAGLQILTVEELTPISHVIQCCKRVL